MYGNILGIDYGTVRIGIAISDSSNKIAFRLEILSSKEFLEKLDNLITKFKIETIVLGNPLGLDSKPTQTSIKIGQVSQQLQDKYNEVNIIKWDETLSTVAAQNNIRLFRKKKNKLDSESARIILQEYLDNNI